jgi:CMD domain protein
VTRTQLQASNDALFTPLDDTEFSVAERLLVAAFATRLTGEDATAARYGDLARAADAERAAVVSAEAAAVATAGPFGLYPEAGLSAESADGPRYTPDAEVVDVLGPRLAAALAHTQLLVSRPRESSAAALDRLLEAGWSPDGIVTLSQLVAFLAFQQRVAVGLRVLAASPPASDTDHDPEDHEEAAA